MRTSRALCPLASSMMAEALVVEAFRHMVLGATTRVV